MTGKRITEKDLDRGKRFAKICEKIFGKVRTDAASGLSCNESSMRNWELGRNIPNEILAKILQHENGGVDDVVYILTGKTGKTLTANQEKQDQPEIIRVLNAVINKTKTDLVKMETLLNKAQSDKEFADSLSLDMISTLYQESPAKPFDTEVSYSHHKSDCNYKKKPAKK